MVLLALVPEHQTSDQESNYPPDERPKSSVAGEHGNWRQESAKDWDASSDWHYSCLNVHESQSNAEADEWALGLSLLLDLS